MQVSDKVFNYANFKENCLSLIDPEKQEGSNWVSFLIFRFFLLTTLLAIRMELGGEMSSPR